MALVVTIFRVDGAAAGGLAALATVSASLAAFAVSFGLPTYATRALSAAALAPTDLIRIHALRATGSVVALSALAAGSAVVVPGDRAAFLLIGTAVLLDQLNETAWVVGRSRGDVRLEAGMNAASSFAVVAIVGGAMISGHGLGLREAAVVQCVAAVVRSVVALRSFARLAECGARSERVTAHLRRACPYAASELLGLAYLRGDTFLVAAVCGTAALGVYSAATALTMPLVQVGASMAAGALALVTRSLPGSDRESTPSGIAAAFSLVGLLVAAALALASPTITTALYGAQGDDVQAVLLVLLCFLPVRFLNFALSAWSLALNRPGGRLAVVAAGAMSNLALNLVVLGPLGVRGAAVATVVSELVVTVAFVLLLSSVTKPLAEALWAVPLTGALTVAVIFAVDSELPAPTSAIALATVLLGIGTALGTARRALLLTPGTAGAQG